MRRFRATLCFFSILSVTQRPLYTTAYNRKQHKKKGGEMKEGVVPR